MFRYKHYSRNGVIFVATYEEMTRNILSDGTVQRTLNDSNLSEVEKYDFIYHIVSRFSGLKRHPNELYYKKDLPADYISLDIETTGLSREDKITQVSAVKVINDKITDTFDSYVNIGDSSIPIHISYLTNISEQLLKDAPLFSEVSENLLSFIEDLPIIGHNITTFDLPFLARNGLDLKHRLAVDTVGYSQTAPLDIPNRKLETLKDYYGIENQSHNSLNDALATIEIYTNLKKNDFERRELNTVYPQILANKKIAYTGTFSNFSRTSIERKITLLGGQVSNSVTKKTDYLVVGTQIAKNLKDGIHSSKELKCLAYIDDGLPIQMLNENEFINLIQEGD